MLSEGISTQKGNLAQGVLEYRHCIIVINKCLHFPNFFLYFYIMKYFKCNNRENYITICASTIHICN